MADAASQVLLGSGLTILSQPLMYVKVLIQHYQECEKPEELGPGNVQKECSSSFDQVIKEFFASMLTYPFVLVSNLMAVNNCGEI
ncbi:Mitochondrial carrier-like protein 2 [Microtus ochrogaster]|uniref:Mitochondrial carrier-like protein 2 n=1 Tax=Microtus ochrogaster TaxID=79684 RepID=A0A8J6KXL0_MICOH|nr:Mitochondrial carrier-like protein 2 [Microtus ochrogaster]